MGREVLLKYRKKKNADGAWGVDTGRLEEYSPHCRCHDKTFKRAKSRQLDKDCSQKSNGENMV